MNEDNINDDFEQLDSVNQSIDLEDSSSSFKSSTENISFNSIDKLVKIKKYWPIISLIVGIILFMVLSVIISTLSISGINYILEKDPITKEKMFNFFSGCGWSTKEECAAKEENNFYDYVEKQYNNYKNTYGVEIDKELIISTLTYVDPFLTSSPDVNYSDMINYKKSKKQVDDLIDAMLSCTLINTKTGTSTSVECDHKVDKENEDLRYHIDKESFRSYLENEFVIKNFLGNKFSEQNKLTAKDIVEEIYSRVEFVHYLQGESNTSNNYVSNNIMVTITDCTGMITLEQMTLYEYLQGVIYMYSDINDSFEYLKFLAVAAKNYLYSINGATEDSFPTSLRIRNCEQNQLYCSPEYGCHYMEETSNSTSTLATGIGSNGYLKGPINDVVTLNKIKTAIDSTTDDYLFENEMLVRTQPSLNHKTAVLDKLNNGSYNDVLLQWYGGSFKNINNNFTIYPLDLKYIKVTSLYGWRVHPVDEDYCSHHNGMDISASADANIYAYASGVVVTNKYSSSYGYYTVIGHGSYNNLSNSYEYYTLYAHQIRLSSLITVGSTVTAGQKIGNVGSTGTSTGNHLHFEIFDSYVDSKPDNRKDPSLYFKNISFTGLDVNVPLYESKAQCSASL